MGGKSKRYFQSSGPRSRSRSPQRDASTVGRTSVQTSLSRQGPPSSRSHYDSSRYAHNKSASDRVKKSIQEESIKPAAGSKSEVGVRAPLSVEEQLKRAHAIEDIKYNPFVPKSFVSSRDSDRTTFSAQSPVSLLDIPLPIDTNSWRENPKLLISSTLYSGSADERKQKWYDNLQAMRTKMRRTSIEKSLPDI